MDSQEKDVVISINTTWSGGFGRREYSVTYNTAQLMMQADFLRAGNRSYRVKSKQVDTSGCIDFYVLEVEDNELL